MRIHHSAPHRSCRRVVSRATPSIQAMKVTIKSSCLSLMALITRNSAHKVQRRSDHLAISIKASTRAAKAPLLSLLETKSSTRVVSVTLLLESSSTRLTRPTTGLKAQPQRATLQAQSQISPALLSSTKSPSLASTM